MLNNKYNPKDFEKKIYTEWLDKKLFSAKVDKNKKSYSIVLPPPNITSNLHIGHAYNATLQDTLIRYKKMTGYETLYQPGTDHAAIATESKIVTALKAQGIDKNSLTKEEFLVYAQEWYDKYNKIILNQFKSMGLACDWDRIAFTMDSHCSLAVRTVFVNLYNEGLIYKGERMTNWCPECNTALSDIEVVHSESNSKLYYIKYPLADGSGYLSVATTRPETILGDVAVAVNPKDEKYSPYVGKNLVLPLLEKEIPILADRMVELDFGTGAVKITPAHDANDYEVSIRHNLPIITVIEKNGLMSKTTGKYAGMDRFKARDEIVKDLQEQGYILKIEDYKNKTGRCDRCKTVVEPAFTEQWFVKMESLAKPAIEAVENGELEFYPAGMKKSYLHWMNNIHDWCISRQLMSGHQIPIYTCSDCNHEFASVDTPSVCPKCNSKNLVQEKDVLDTWFSSALWPMSTLGFPDGDKEFFDYFYPNAAIVTAYEILHLWVSRMIFSGIKHAKKIPFGKAFIHGVVKDAHGTKMSKNLGNGVDPLDVIEQYGIDSLRFSLVHNLSLSLDSKYSASKAENSSIFFNKIYNAAKFVLNNIPEKIVDIKDINLNIYDKWILSELNTAISQIEKCVDVCEIGEYANICYELIWNKFCDKYIEYSKVNSSFDTKNVLFYVFNSLLKLLHPIAPFITEHLYKELNGQDKNIFLDSMPTVINIENIENDLKIYNMIDDIISNVRSMRASLSVAENTKTDASIISSSDESIKTNEAYIKKMCLLNNLYFDEIDTENCISNITDYATIYVKNPNVLSKEKALDKLNKQLDLINLEIERSDKMLSNAGFVSKAPEKLIIAEKEKLNANIEIKNNILESISKL